MSRIDEDEAELQSLVGKGVWGCRIDGCVDKTVDERGPVFMRNDDGTTTEYLVCEDHFEAVFMILGTQERGAKVWADEPNEGDYIFDDQAEEHTIITTLTSTGSTWVREDVKESFEPSGSTPYQRGYRLLEELEETK